jgi:hypothetical protein
VVHVKKLVTAAYFGGENAAGIVLPRQCFQAYSCRSVGCNIP